MRTYQEKAKQRQAARASPSASAIIQIACCRNIFDASHLRPDQCACTGKLCDAHSLFTLEGPSICILIRADILRARSLLYALGAVNFNGKNSSLPKRG